MRFAGPASEAIGPVLGDGVQGRRRRVVGAHVVVRAGARIGEGCVIEHGAILGKSPRLARTQIYVTASSVGEDDVLLGRVLR